MVFDELESEMESQRVEVGEAGKNEERREYLERKRKKKQVLQAAEFTWLVLIV